MNRFFSAGLFLFLIVIIALLSSCGNKPNFMKYDVVFYAPLGTNNNEIGSNIPVLKTIYTNENDFFINDYLDVPTSIKIFRNKIYIADKYNNRISVYPLIAGAVTNTPILSAGDGYGFGTPFQVLLNKYGEIYVLASLSNYPYSYQTNNGVISVQESQKDSTNYNQYYIYKFSTDGKFIYEIGENGIHSEPMAYPDRIDIDLFDNVYAYFKEYDNDMEQWLVKRFSPSGELTFEFNTKYFSPTNNMDDKVFLGRIGDVYNLKNDERLLIYSDNYIIERKNKNNGSFENITTPDEFYRSLDVYSILQNAITKNIFTSKKYTDEFINITKDDILVLYSFDEKYTGIRFRFIDIGNGTKKEEVYYAPVISDHYMHVKYFVDDNGQIYSIIIKDNSYFVVLQWRKQKSRELS